MPDKRDIDLLREYAGSRSESAFEEIVHRHINLVYSVALRFTGIGEDAQDVAQMVFTILARKAARLPPKTILTGWLYETTRFSAMNFLTHKSRRQAREQEAYMQSTLNDAETESIWQQLELLLEGAMSQLSERDRTLVLLRFFENKSFGETAMMAGMNEWAARKRVERSMEKLRAYFSKRGVASSAAIIAGALSANSVQAAPVALAKSITAVAMTKGVAASVSTLTLMKEALKIMAWTNAKTAIVVSAAVIVAAGTTTLVIQHQHQTHARTDFPQSSWVLAGYTDPASALETVFWAGNHADGKTLLASMTPDLQQQLQQRFEGELQKRGMSLEEFFTQSAKGHVSAITGFRVLNQEVVADNQIILHLYVQGKEREDTFKMKKIGNEWKLDQLPPAY